MPCRRCLLRGKAPPEVAAHLNGPSRCHSATAGSLAAPSAAAQDAGSGLEESWSSRLWLGESVLPAQKRGQLPAIAQQRLDPSLPQPEAFNLKAQQAAGMFSNYGGIRFWLQERSRLSAAVSAIDML
jgi:hypothetical protein